MFSHSCVSCQIGQRSKCSVLYSTLVNFQYKILLKQIQEKNIQSYERSNYVE